MVEDKWGVNQRLVFMYDENGAPNTVYYYNGSTSATKYYYVLNLQGDVTEIRSTSNALVAQYNYDAFGNILSIKDANGNNITSSTHIANVNPLRYRGYFYDPETGFYYLNSRYYDPATRRFISADSIIDERDFDSLNLYSYCGNDPVNRKDNGGAWWDIALDLVSIGFSIADVAMHPTDPWAWVGLGADIACTAVPFISGGGTVVRAATKVDDVIDATKAVSKVDDVVDVAKPAGLLVSVPDFSKGINNSGKLLDRTEILNDFRLNQKALSDLGKEIDRNAKYGKFISYDEAKIFDEWCLEYSIPQHHGATIGSGNHWVTGWDHTHFYGRHIPFK